MRWSSEAAPTTFPLFDRKRNTTAVSRLVSGAAENKRYWLVADQFHHLTFVLMTGVQRERIAVHMRIWFVHLDNDQRQKTVRWVRARALETRILRPKIYESEWIDECVQTENGWVLCVDHVRFARRSQWIFNGLIGLCSNRQPNEEQNLRSNYSRH